MRYIIMCGGTYQMWSQPRQLTKVCGESIIERTIRLLRENGVTDIAISSDNDIFNQFGVPVLKHDNNWTVIAHGVSRGMWCDCFYPTKEPVCYICGDVVFSPEAIKTIVETKTNDIEFFASAPPFCREYTKPWAEPFAFKVVNTEHLFQSIAKVKEYREAGLFRREPIAWELWQVIKDTPLNRIDYKNYTVINDYTCDIDEPADVAKIEHYMIGIDEPMYMIHTCNDRFWYVNDYLIPSMREQGINNILVYRDVDNEGCLKSHIKSLKKALTYNVQGMWHLQDDVIICRDFAKRTKELSKDYTVCGFSSYYDKMKQWEPGDSNGLKMWYSFPCIYIPTKIVQNYIDWFDIWVWRDPQFGDWIKEKKYDDTFFRIYMENYYSEEYVLNLKPNLVDHIDYLLGGSVINAEVRKGRQIRSLSFEDLDLIDKLEKKLKDNQ